MKCQYDGCNTEIASTVHGQYRTKQRPYALYRLIEINGSFLKRWVNVCSKHDKIIAQEARKLRHKYPDAEWREI